MSVRGTWSVETCGALSVELWRETLSRLGLEAAFALGGRRLEEFRREIFDLLHQPREVDPSRATRFIDVADPVARAKFRRSIGTSAARFILTEA